MSSKIALLIDAENISYKSLPLILEEVPLHGQLVVRAVYGDWERPNLQKWHELAEKNNFKIRHQTNASKTKNSSDMKLIMDAMEVLYRTPIDIFCLVTNDADYIPLCDKIHESKKVVIGLGYQHASEAFIRACDKFIFMGRGELPAESLLSVPVEAPVILPKQPAPPKSNDQAVIRKLLTDAFAKAPQDANKWVALTALGSTLRQVQADFQTNSYGHATLTKLLQSMPDFVELGNADKSARLKSKITPKQAKLNDLQKLVSEAFAKAPRDANRWVTLSALGSALLQAQPDFQTSSYGHATLTKLLQSMPDFVELQANGTVKSARLKN